MLPCTATDCAGTHSTPDDRTELWTHPARVHRVPPRPCGHSDVAEKTLHIVTVLEGDLDGYQSLAFFLGLCGASRPFGVVMKSGGESGSLECFSCNSAGNERSITNCA